MTATPVILANGSALAAPSSATESTTIAVGQEVALSLQSTTGFTSFEWVVTRRPFGSTATLGSTTGYTSTFTPDEPGEYRFRGLANGGEVRQDVALIVARTRGRGLRKAKGGERLAALAEKYNVALDELDLTKRTFSVRAYGASSAATAAINTAAFVACIAAATAAGGGVLVVPEDAGGNYQIDDEIALTSNLRVEGRGTVEQTVAGKAIFVGTSLSNVVVSELDLTGIRRTAFTSNEQAVRLTSCSDVLIEDLFIHSVGAHAAYLTDCSDAIVRDCTIYDITDGIRLRGCVRVDVVGNTLRDPSTPAGTFIGGIFLDSTDGHAFGYCTDINIDGNTVQSYVNSQAIEVHAGERITIGGGNRLLDVGGVAVSINPYAVADRCRNITIGPLVIECTDTVGCSTAFGISIQGGAAGAVSTDPGYWVENVTINGATIKNANAPTAASYSGAGIVLQYAKGVTINGAVCDGCYGSALWLAGNVKNIRGHVVARNILTGNGRRSGVLVNGTASTCEGRIAVQCDDVAQGVQYDSAATSLIVDVDGSSITTRVGGQTTGRVDGVGGYTAGATTIDVSGGVRYVRVANSGPTSITNLTNAVEGQLVTLVFADANTTITRANAVLKGSASFTSSQYATLTLVKSSTLWHEVCRETTNG